MNSDNFSPTFETLTLEVKDFYYSRLLDHAFLRNLRPEVKVDFHAHQAAICITAMMRVFSKELKNESIQYPDGWWEWFKLDQLPTFCRWLNHSPRYKIHNFTATALYPSVPRPHGHDPKYHQTATIVFSKER